MLEPNSRKLCLKCPIRSHPHHYPSAQERVGKGSFESPEQLQEQRKWRAGEIWSGIGHPTAAGALSRIYYTCITHKQCVDICHVLFTFDIYLSIYPSLKPILSIPLILSICPICAICPISAILSYLFDPSYPSFLSYLSSMSELFFYLILSILSYITIPSIPAYRMYPINLSTYQCYLTYLSYLSYLLYRVYRIIYPVCPIWPPLASISLRHVPRNIH